MQPSRPPNGVSVKSLLFHSLEVYLNHKNRQQPIIGLSCVTECVKAGTGGEVLYLCEVCVCRLRQPDILNHITGSLHRFNYIKTWHSHFMAEWKEESTELSKLAWPLMEIAKTLEEREGPGDAQVQELEAAVYKEMTSHSETDAMTLLQTIRCGREQGKTQSQSETPLTPLDSPTVQSQEVVWSPQKHPVQPIKPQLQSLKSFIQLKRASVDTDKPPALTQKSTASSVKLPGPLEKASMVLESGTNQGSLEPLAQSENSTGFFDGYTGTKPLIGLGSVVECRSEDGGLLSSFLCHSCRIKSTNDSIVDHLTSSSHYLNYIMETHPEHVEVMRAGLNDDCLLLQSLAKKLEEEEGRGEVKVMRVPAALCVLLSRNTYHWCVKALSDDNSWTSTNIQKRKLSVTGPDVSVPKASDKSMVQKHIAVLPNEGKKVKMENVSNPVFKVSLQLAKGPLLLERTSFSQDTLPVTPTYSPAAEPSLSAPHRCPCPWTPGCGPLSIDHAQHTTRLGAETPQHGVCNVSGDTDGLTGSQYPGQERNFSDTLYQKEDGYFSDSQCFNQLENTTGASPCERRLPHNQQPTFEAEDGSSSEFKKGIGSRLEVPSQERQGEVNTTTTYYCQHLLQQKYQQYQIQYHTRPPANSAGLYFSSGGMARHLGMHRGIMGPQRGDSVACWSGIAAEHRMQISEVAYHGQWSYGSTLPSSDYVQTAPAYITQPHVYPSFPVGHRVTSDPYYNDGHRTTTDQPNTNTGGLGSQPHMFIPPGQAQGHGTQPGPYSTGFSSGFSDVMIPGNTGRAPSPYISSYPSPSTDSPHLTAPYWGQIPAPHPGGHVPVAAPVQHGSSNTQFTKGFY